MRGIILAGAMVILLSAVASAKPLIGIAGVESYTPRGNRISALLESHLVNISDSIGIFEMVNPRLLKEQLSRFNCLEEKCLVRFGKNAGFGLLVRGRVRDRGSSLILDMAAYGTDIPHSGKLIYRRTVEVPVVRGHGTREYSYICEEHAGFFYSEVLKRYRDPVFAEKDGKGAVRFDAKINGTYTVYKMEESSLSVKPFAKKGRFSMANGRIKSGEYVLTAENFILKEYRDKAAFLNEFYYGRKKEIVIRNPRLYDLFYAIFLSGPASATMPLTAPFVGYYGNADWTGISLWAINSAPYIYLEIDGLTNYYKNYHQRRKDTPRDVLTRFYFAWYMFGAGGTPLVVDALAHTYLNRAANYQGIQPLLGNNYIAAYLSLVSGGGGLFYKGHRHWGYLYFHLNNVLVYLTIREFTGTRRYDPLRNTYRRGGYDEKMAYTWVGILGAVKIAEIIHVVFTRTRLRNGRIIREKDFMEPVVYTGYSGEAVFGLCHTMKF